MRWFLRVFIVVSLAILNLEAQQKPKTPGVLKTVDPDYGKATPQFAGVTDYKIELGVDAQGDLVSISVLSGPSPLQGLPENLVRALMKYEFGRSGQGYVVKMTIPYGVTVDQARLLTLNPLIVPADQQRSKVIKHTTPRYPEYAKSLRRTGKVVFQALIDGDGKTQELRSLRGALAFFGNAYGVVKDWEYEPTLVNGAKTPVLTEVSIEFDLR